MNFDQLRYFIETAKFEHIGKAAKSVAISPSAISHAIANLEEEFGRKLFEKKGKRIFLTPHGKTLFEQGERLIRQMEAVASSMLSDDRSLQGHYRLAASHLISSHILSPQWAKIASDHPDLSCELFSLRSAQVVTGVSLGEFDMGLCFSPQAHPDVEAIPIHQGQLRVAVKSRHSLIGKSVTDVVDELVALPVAMPKAFHGIDVCEQHPQLEKIGLLPRPAFVYDNYEVAANFLKAGDGWALMPEWVVDVMSLKTLNHPKTWNAPYSIQALVPKKRPLPKSLKVLVEQLQANLKLTPSIIGK